MRSGSIEKQTESRMTLFYHPGYCSLPKHRNQTLNEEHNKSATEHNERDIEIVDLIVGTENSSVWKEEKA